MTNLTWNVFFVITECLLTTEFVTTECSLTTDFVITEFYCRCGLLGQPLFCELQRFLLARWLCCQVSEVVEGFEWRLLGRSLKDKVVKKFIRTVVLNTSIKTCVKEVSWFYRSCFVGHQGPENLSLRVKICNGFDLTYCDDYFWETIKPLLKYLVSRFLNKFRDWYIFTWS